MSKTFTLDQLDKMRISYAQIDTIDPGSIAYNALINKLDKMEPPMLQQIADAKIKFLSGLARNRVNRAKASVKEATTPPVYAEIIAKMVQEIQSQPYIADETMYKKAVHALLTAKPVVPVGQVNQLMQIFVKAHPYSQYRIAKKTGDMRTSNVAQESTRLVKTQEDGKKTAKIYRDSDTEEYIVKFYVDGVYQRKADYFTDDKQDAIGTAKAELKRRSFNTVKEDDSNMDDTQPDTDGEEKNPRDIEKEVPSDLDLDWISKFDLGEIKEAIQKIVDHLSETDDEEQVDLLRNDIRILDNLHNALSKKDSEAVDKHWKIAKSEGSHEHLHPEFTSRLDDATATVAVQEGYTAEADTAIFKNKAKWNQAAKKYRVKETGKSLTAFCKDTGKMMGRFASEKGWLETC
jgi:hypothetical protein